MGEVELPVVGSRHGPPLRLDACAYSLHGIADAVRGLEADLYRSLGRGLGEGLLDDERNGYALASIDGPPVHESVESGL